MLATIHGNVIGVILRREQFHPANVRRAAVFDSPQIDFTETFIRPDVSVGAEHEREELKFLHLLTSGESEKTQVMQRVQNVIWTLHQAKIRSQMIARSKRKKTSPHHLRPSIGESQIIPDDFPLEIHGEEDVYDSFRMWQHEVMTGQGTFTRVPGSGTQELR